VDAQVDKENNPIELEIQMTAGLDRGTKKLKIFIEGQAVRSQLNRKY
jgi:hypothetical protein